MVIFQNVNLEVNQKCSGTVIFPKEPKKFRNYYLEHAIRATIVRESDKILESDSETEFFFEKL